jgi:hypothetical protein
MSDSDGTAGIAAGAATVVVALSDSSPAAPSFADVTVAVLMTSPGVAGASITSVNVSVPAGIVVRSQVSGVQLRFRGDAGTLDEFTLP